MHRDLKLVPVFLSLICCAAMVSGQTSPNDVVLTVNGEPIYAWEVGLMAPQVGAEMARQSGERPDAESVSKAAVERLIDMRLIAQEAKRQKLELNEDRIDQAVAAIEQQAGGREALESALSRYGITYDQLRSNVAESDLVQSFVESEIEPGVAVSDEEVTTFFNDNPAMFARPEQVHARHILIKSSPDDAQEDRESARSRAAVARERAVSGEDFADLARELSEGPSAGQGGDLGFFSREQMVGPFSEAAFALEPGGISEVVETRFGYHVIELEEKRPAATMTLDEAREPLKKMLHDQRVGEALQARLKELADAATIARPEPSPAAAEGAPNEQ